MNKVKVMSIFCRRDDIIVVHILTVFILLISESIVDLFED